MATREEMLSRVQKALGRPTPASLPPLERFDYSGIMPLVQPEDYHAKFEAAWEKVSGASYRVTNMDELDAVFQVILAVAETHAVALSRNPLLAELRIADRLT